MDAQQWQLVSDLSAGEPPRFVSAKSASVVDPSGNEWLAFGSNGAGDGALNGVVRTVVVSDLALIVGGDFTNAAGVATADYLAYWDGYSWSGLGSNGAGDGALNGPVYALAGFNQELYAAGDFTNVAGIAEADYVARWTSNVWTTLGPQGAGTPALNAPARTLAAADLSLYIGGQFTDAAGLATADHIVRWDGAAWFALGSDGAGQGALNGDTLALVLDANYLYVGGAFSNAGAVAAADHVARWDGTSWSALGSDGNGEGALNDNVFALAQADGVLYAGGGFTDAAGLAAADYVARWNGSAWSALGSDGAGNGALNGSVFALATWGGTLLVGGAFINAAAKASADYVARWNGSTWSELGSDGAGNGALSAEVTAILPFSSAIYLGGRFLNGAGLSTADFLVLALLPGPWTPLGSNGAGNGSLNDLVTALLVWNGHLYVGGFFTDAGGVAEADYVARWDGASWSALGSDGSGNGALKHGVAVLFGTASDLYVGGYFENAAGIAEADYLTRWDGSAWSALGSNGSGDGALNSAVRGLALIGSALYVGGQFTDAGGSASADYIALWNGTAWSPIGPSQSGYPSLYYPVLGLAAVGSDLYVSGIFPAFDGVTGTEYLARWNSSGWSTVGSTASGSPSVNGAVNALAVSGTQLYVAGNFTNAGGVPTADRIARWTGSSWAALGSDGAGDGALKDRAFAVFVHGANVYVGGRFLDAAGIPEADHIARWDGSAWSALGSNGAGDGVLNGDVYALSVADNALAVGGLFTNANGNPTSDFVAGLSLGGPAYRPDGRIKKGSGTLVGNNIYNTDGANQTKSGSASRRSTISFTISIQNDSSSGRDRFSVVASGATASGYKVRYYRGTTEITSAVVAGTYVTPKVSHGSAVRIKAKVRVLRGAAVGSSVTRLITITSVADVTKVDAVKFIGKRR